MNNRHTRSGLQKANDPPAIAIGEWNSQHSQFGFADFHIMNDGLAGAQLRPDPEIW
jgi:hypothetical protein